MGVRLDNITVFPCCDGRAYAARHVKESDIYDVHVPPQKLYKLYTQQLTEDLYVIRMCVGMCDYLYGTGNSAGMSLGS